LKCGDILKIKDEEYIPADLVLLRSSDPKGECYIETKNLDGETNLKLKSNTKEVNHMYQGIAEEELMKSNFSNISGSIEYEAPNNAIYKFSGSWKLEDKT
jgi:P-type E1-E2 ATPase